jgi:hypothetical protein
MKSLACPINAIIIKIKAPIINGCGIIKIKRLNRILNRKFTPCCNQHDICYSTCGTTQKYCDVLFNNCMKKKSGNSLLYNSKR